jgi:hypothetical protein
MHFTINGTLAYIYSIRRDNPLEREDDVKQKAGAFWREHKLHMVVDEDVFVKGAWIFKDLKGTRDFEYCSRNETNTKNQNTSTRQERLSGLSSLENWSLRQYASRTNYADEHEPSTSLKSIIFAVGDGVSYSIRHKSDVAEDKFLWDHIKTFSKAQWQIFSACCLAAMTQYWTYLNIFAALLY